MDEATPERPIYKVMPEDAPPPSGTTLYMIVCDEGWRSSIVGTGMYKWSADWLVKVLDRRPYAPEMRP